MIETILLGISSSTPTKNRNLTGLAIKFNGEVFLFDTPENVQRQFMKTKTSYMDVNNIFITHFHADHFIGIFGLLATMSLHERTKPITIYGPKGIKEKILTGLNVFDLNLKYNLNFITLKNGLIFENEKCLIYTKKVNHSLENYGFVFKEKDKIGKFIKEKALKLGIPEGPLYSKLQKGATIELNGKKITPDKVIDYSYKKIGKKIGYFVDLLDTGILDFIKDVDLLFHEATFLDKDKEQAKKTKHSITKEVAKMLEKTKVKKWIMINFSTRYKDLEPLLFEAQEFFPNSEIGEELRKYKL